MNTFISNLISYMEQYHFYDSPDGNIAEETVKQVAENPEDVMQFLLNDVIDGTPDAKPILIQMIQNY